MLSIRKYTVLQFFQQYIVCIYLQLYRYLRIPLYIYKEIVWWVSEEVLLTFDT